MEEERRQTRPSSRGLLQQRVSFSNSLDVKPRAAQVPEGYATTNSEHAPIGDLRDPSNKGTGSNQHPPSRLT